VNVKLLSLLPAAMGWTLLAEFRNHVSEAVHIPSPAFKLSVPIIGYSVLHAGIDIFLARLAIQLEPERDLEHAELTTASAQLTTAVFQTCVSHALLMHQ
jgi:hypothetical protein